MFPIVTETNGASLMAAVGFAAELNANASSPLHGRIDTARLGLAGHSMGGEDVIKAAAQLPAGKVNVAISQHPSLCGPFGPPPYACASISHGPSRQFGRPATPTRF